MAVKFYTDDCDFRFHGKLKTAAWLKEVATQEGFKLGNVSYIFCSSKRHREINNQYLKHDYYTDVITFDETEIYNPRRSYKGQVNGDIFIDPETVFLNAKEFNTNELTELKRVIVHGLLHLCQYGDKSTAEEEQMRALENKYLSCSYGETIK